MFHRSTVPAARVIRTLTLGLLAITLPLSARGLYGPQGAWVHVRWQPSVDATERQRLETAWQLVDGQEVSPSTWRYDLTAPTADRLRAIVEHPDAADTHYIDRQRYTLAHETLRTARRHGLITVGGAVAVDIVDRLAVLLAVLAGLCALAKHPMRASRQTVAAVARWLQPYLETTLKRLTRGVPNITAEAAGAFRVCFGLGLLGMVVLGQSYDDPSMKVATVTALALFTIGLWSRPAYVVSILSITFQAVVQQYGHDWTILLLTLWSLLPARWGDGLSVDTAIRRWRHGVPGPRLRGKAYGFAVWLPGLTLGCALAAAAFAKLQSSGLDWAITGAVRFHFLEDSFRAPVDWGLWVAAQYPVAVFLSFGALVVETGFILNIFFAGAWTRAAFGLFGFMLFVGFYVFQGVLWRPWWIVLTAFLPWGLIGRHATSGWQAQPVKLGLAHLLVIVIVVVQQVIASAWKIEIGPLLSNYPMYSYTFESPEAFDRRMRNNRLRTLAVDDPSPNASARPRRGERLLFSSGATDISARVQGIPNAAETLLNAADAIASGEGIRAPVTTALRGVRHAYQARYGDDLDVVTVTADLVTFDWQQGRFHPLARVRIANVPLSDADLGY